MSPARWSRSNGGRGAGVRWRLLAVSHGPAHAYNIMPAIRGLSQCIIRGILWRGANSRSCGPAGANGPAAMKSKWMATDWPSRLGWPSPTVGPECSWRPSRSARPQLSARSRPSSKRRAYECDPHTITRGAMPSPRPGRWSQTWSVAAGRLGVARGASGKLRVRTRPCVTNARRRLHARGACRGGGQPAPTLCA